MTRRIAKQLLYGFLYLVVLAAIVFGLYRLFVVPAPSCTNGVQDQNETGVDCGGVCGIVCTSAAKTIDVVGDVRVFRPTTDRTVLLVELRNPNADLAAQNFRYRFDLQDDSGASAGTVSGDSYLYAGEIRYLAAFGNGSAAARATLTVENPDWVATAVFPQPTLTVRDSQFASSTGMFTVTGHIVNRGTLTLPAVTVLAIFNGRFGEPAGASQTELDLVTPGEERAFTVVYPAIPNVADPKPKLFVTARYPS